MNNPIHSNTKWYDIPDNGHDVVISSRVRLARNLEEFPFVPKLDHAGSEKIAEKVTAALQNAWDTPLTVTHIASLGAERKVLLEDHLISPEFCTDSPLERILITDQSTNLAVMVCEEDHVRIQSIYSGFELDKAYETACKADDALASSVPIAFDETLGYLTACPTNLGTGLRASVMLHLPAMCAYGYIKSLGALMAKIGLTVRGIYGEGSEALACMYQLSNQITLGLSESDAIEKLKNAVNQIISKERELRSQMMQNPSSDIADKLWRSYGTLKYARKLDTAEAARLLSNVRLAAVCGVIPEVKNINLVGLLFEIMPAHIASRFSDATTAEKRDERRTALIRETLERA